MSEADIGLIGLGVMGANLALNIAEKGYTIAVFNRTTSKTREFLESAGELESTASFPARRLEEFVAAIRPPRSVIIMVKAGEPVDEQIEQLMPLLTKGDIIIDAATPTSTTRSALR